MKDLMIEQLKKELEKNIEQLMTAKEKESQMGQVIHALTMQNAMMNTTAPAGKSGGAPQ